MTHAHPPLSSGRTALVLLLTLSCPMIFAQAATDAFTPVAVGDLAPVFTEKRYDAAGTFDLKALRGRVVIVNFWATWCEPCRTEIPLLQKLSREFSGKVTVVGVAVFSSDAAIRDYVKELAISYPVVGGSYDLMGRYNKVSAVPTTYLVGKQGEVRKISVGAVTESELRAALQSALAG